MSTHNIGFYEDLTKIIFQLSSNIIKYAPYLFFHLEQRTNKVISVPRVLSRDMDLLDLQHYGFQQTCKCNKCVVLQKTHNFWRTQLFNFPIIKILVTWFM